MMTPPPTTLSLSFFFLLLGTIGITSIHGFHLLPIPPSTSSRPSQPHTKQQRRDLSFFSGSSSSSASPLAFAAVHHRSNSNSRLFVASSAQPEDDKEEESAAALSSASSSSVDNDNNKNFNFDFNLLPKFDNVLIANAVSLGIVILFVFVGFNLLSNGLSIASSAVMDEIGREVMNLLGSLASLLLALGGVILKLLQYVIPVVGKGISNGVTIATPVIQDVSMKVVESQLVQDATTAVNQATAPIVDTVTQTVDTTVITPIQDLTNTVQTQLNHAVDTNIVTPIKTATDSLTDSVSGAVDSNIVTPVKEATDSITGTVTHIFDSTFLSSFF